MKLYTQAQGSGPDFVLLHGWNQDHYSLQSLADSLSDRYRVTLVDLPGAGKSDWDPAFQSVNEVTDAMLAVLPPTAIYLGWSWGGAVVQSLAGRYPDRVKQAIIVGSVPKFMAAEGWQGMPEPGFEPLIELIADDDALKDLIADYLKTEFIGQEENCQPLLDYLEKNGLPMSPAISIQGMQIIQHADLRSEFAAITCPIDFIVGEKDEVIQVDWDQVKGLNPNTRVHLVEGAMHMPFWTHQEEFASQLAQALAR
jgi:pimeloyl-[acyl-carrier protein] methyl ester esterase